MLERALYMHAGGGREMVDYIKVTAEQHGMKNGWISEDLWPGYRGQRQK